MLEGLTQRRQKYQSTADQAKADGNGSKSRRMMRIVKQYDDAIKMFKLGKHFDVTELPVPVGYPSLPGDWIFPGHFINLNFRAVWFGIGYTNSIFSPVVPNCFSWRPKFQILYFMLLRDIFITCLWFISPGVNEKQQDISDVLQQAANIDVQRDDSNIPQPQVATATAAIPVGYLEL